MSTLEQFISGVRHTLWGPELQPLQLFPRKPENIFESGTTLKKVLPAEFQEVHGGYSSDLKKIEIHFYPDLGTTRTVTAFVSGMEEKQIVPLSGRKVYFRLAAGSAADAKLKSNEGESGDDGMVSIEVEHPATTPPGLELIFVQASLNEQFQPYSQLNFRVCRNQDVSADLSQLVSGETFLVRQSENLESSPGVKRIQELLNQVVARKKSADGFEWLVKDGLFGNGLKGAVEELLSKFSDSFDYEKGKFDVKVNELVKEYIKNEYGDYEEGTVVDRSLLIGTKLWSESDPVNEIDGLLDIYNGVVRRFFAEMLRLSETYTGCDTFWLHRPSHKRYKAGKAFEAQLKESLDLLVDSKADAEVVKNEKTEATEKVSKGETHKVTQTKKIETTVWYKLRRKDGVEGWVPASKCKAMTNDRPIAVNAGTFGMPGVAYSFGCKDRPGEYNQLLDGNALKPDKIKTWQQYEKRHKPGKTSGDSDTINWTGVDCSGFTQNCVTDSLLSDNTRIVPQSRLKRIIRKPIGSEGNWAYSATCVPARKFVGDYARQIPYHADDPDKQWLDITDLITSEGHIVWVTEESPDAAENQRDFEVANAYGGYTRKNQKPKLPTDKFIRKVIRMPFKWWGIYCGGNGIKLGRIYFWS